MEDVRFNSEKEKWGEFSNFARYPIAIEGKEWPTSEHYFQAMKFEGTKIEEKIRLMSSPNSVARFARDRKLPLRKDWDKVRDKVMKKAVLVKFTQHSELRELLLSTGDRSIVERTHRDSYWGDGGNGKGKNMLGKILMDVRKELVV